MDHELVVVFNGVVTEQRPVLMAELDGIEHRLLTLDEPVQDLVAYRRAAERLDHERICFLNSYSVILAQNWLSKLTHALDQPDAGLVGATGSWASLRSWALNALRLPSAYRAVVPDREAAFQQFRDLQLELAEGRNGDPPIGGGPRRSPAERLRAFLQMLQSLSEQIARFKGFPAVHVRTNGFMVRRAMLGQVRVGGLARKMDAYSLESGRHNLTRQISDMGLRALVVSRDGSLYDAGRWPQSRTFWQGDQENLLIADNQTRLYANGGLDRRRLLSALAWGIQAEPRCAASQDSAKIGSR